MKFKRTRIIAVASVCSLVFFTNVVQATAQDVSAGTVQSKGEVEGKVDFLNASVVFPRKPELITKNLDSKQGPLTQKIYQLVDKDNGRVFLVQTVEFPDKTNFNTDAALLSSVQQFKMRGKMQAERDVKLGELEGKEVIVERQDGAVFRSRVFADQQTAATYSIEVIATTQEMVESADAKSFFESASYQKAKD